MKVYIVKYKTYEHDDSVEHETHKAFANKKDAIKVSLHFLNNLLDNNIIDITPVKKELKQIGGY